MTMKIASIASLSYTPGQVEYFQFIRGGVGADYHQGPYFYQFPDGDLLMFWGVYDFDESSNNCVSLYSISKDRGITWSSPQVFMADYLGGVPFFVQMLRLRQSRRTMMLFARCRQDEIAVDEERRVATTYCDYFKSSTRFFLRWSNDGGRSFDHGREIAYTDICGEKVLPGVGFYGSLDLLMELVSGRILAAFMFMDPTRSDAEKRIQHYTGVCLLSDDGGRTWKRSGEISVDTPRGVMELQMVETEPNRLLCLFRTQGGYLYQTVSEDGGATWGRSEPSPLPSPESMARMIKLQSGNLLVVWNNISSTTQQPRHPLAATISRDAGHTWSPPRVIADETGSNQLSNHGLIQLDDGRILLGVSHYRDVRPMTGDLDLAIFDEKWLLT
jgi:hypothetical protein